MPKRRAMNTTQARKVKQAGHADESRFADLIGGRVLHSSEKADVTGGGNRLYSVKSGNQKWQAFLYGKSRFQTDRDFVAMNGVGQLLAECVDAFPEEFEKSRGNKDKYKQALRAPMRALKDKLSHPNLLEKFFTKSLFNGDEVDFLAVKDGRGIFHVFHQSDVSCVLSENVRVENSRAKARGQVSDQKVVFKTLTPSGFSTLGEIELRREPRNVYRKIKFWLDKNKTLHLLICKLTPPQPIICEKVLVYGKAADMLSESNIRIGNPLFPL